MRLSQLNELSAHSVVREDQRLSMSDLLGAPAAMRHMGEARGTTYWMPTEWPM